MLQELPVNEFLHFRPGKAVCRISRIQVAFPLDESEIFGVLLCIFRRRNGDVVGMSAVCAVPRRGKHIVGNIVKHLLTAPDSVKNLRHFLNPQIVRDADLLQFPDGNSIVPGIEKIRAAELLQKTRDRFYGAQRKCVIGAVFPPASVIAEQIEIIVCGDDRIFP